MNTEQSAYLEVFFKTYFSELQVHAFCILDDWDWARTAVTDAFEIACEKIDIFLKKKNQVGWMKNVVRNVCLNLIRQRNQHAKLLIAWEEITEKQMPSREDHYGEGFIEECKALLSDQEYQMLHQALLLGIPYDELARLYGISMWACRKRVQRTMAKLRNFFAQNE